MSVEPLRMSCPHHAHTRAAHWRRADAAAAAEQTRVLLDTAAPIGDVLPATQRLVDALEDIARHELSADDYGCTGHADCPARSDAA